MHVVSTTTRKAESSCQLHTDAPRGRRERFRLNYMLMCDDAGENELLRNSCSIVANVRDKVQSERR